MVNKRRKKEIKQKGRENDLQKKEAGKIKLKKNKKNQKRIRIIIGESRS